MEIHQWPRSRGPCVTSALQGLGGVISLLPWAYAASSGFPSRFAVGGASPQHPALLPSARRLTALGWLSRQGAEVPSLSPPLHGYLLQSMAARACCPSSQRHLRSPAMRGVYPRSPSEQAEARGVCAQKSGRELQAEALRVQGAFSPL